VSAPFAEAQHPGFHGQEQSVGAGAAVAVPMTASCAVSSPGGPPAGPGSAGDRGSTRSRCRAPSTRGCPSRRACSSRARRAPGPRVDAGGVVEDGGIFAGQLEDLVEQAEALLDPTELHERARGEVHAARTRAGRSASRTAGCRARTRRTGDRRAGRAPARATCSPACRPARPRRCARGSAPRSAPSPRAICIASSTACAGGRSPAAIRARRVSPYRSSNTTYGVPAALTS